ncbi:MAG: hypothetical protein BKP49_01760 [Treponema sp. CETP13]|nr:MAG: hypothetical protein BKP49_01760 [Treponema sp. CETP13]
MKRTEILIIDPQNDFCDPNGSLYIEGAVEDCKNIVNFINRNSNKISNIHITLDSHPSYHIAHPIFWKDTEGNSPKPFTVINAKDIQNGTYRPVDKELTSSVEQYAQELEAKGRYQLTIWPMHCLTATWGACVQKDIIMAAHEWELSNICKNILYTFKSDNPLTEHYSAVQAEVPIPWDESTKINFKLIDSLRKADNIIVVGEALSHCLANTINDLLVYLPAKKFTLLTDCTSPVKGFEKDANKFLQETTSKGLKTAISTELKL